MRGRKLFVRIIFFLFGFILIGLFFSFLYVQNNKYTNNSVQPRNGCLTVTDELFEKESLLYLYQDWEFYYQALLTPEDVEQQNFHGAYMEYVNIGESNNYAGTNIYRQAHGCGTYILHIRFPQKSRQYTIEVPEIYSSYRFYVNRKLIGSCGNPGKTENDNTTYVESVQTRSFTFDAAGDVTLMFATKDLSHYYSGLTYPPGLGTEETVSHHAFLQIIFYGVVITICIISAVLTLYYWLRFCLKKSVFSAFSMHAVRKNPLLFIFISLFGAGAMCYPIVHYLYPVGIHPAYILEMVSGYLIVLLIVILHNSLTILEHPIAFISGRIMVGITAAICVMALLYSAFSAHLTGEIELYFSRIVSIYKVVVALYLLVRSAVALKQQAVASKALFFGTFFYACCFVFDRIFVAYEPIYGGWFAEYGILILILTSGYTLWKELLGNYNHSLMLQEEYKQMCKQMDIQTAYNEKTNQALEQNRRQRHDFRHHLAVIKSFAENANQQELITYVSKLSEQHTATAVRLPVFCEHTSVNALLQYYYDQALSQQIDISLQMEVPESLFMNEIEFCAILGNLLENAIEACKKVRVKGRCIHATAGFNAGMYLIAVDNSHKEEIKRKGNMFYSTKHEGIGIGTSSVMRIVEKYNGIIDFNISANYFGVTVGIGITPDFMKGGPADATR